MAALTAFVTDGNQRAALAIVRALGRRGVTVVVGDDRPTSLSSESRYCARHVTYPSPERHPANFDAFLLDFVRREKIDVLLPVTDVTTRAVSSSQDALRQHCAVAVPPLASYELVTDKCALLRTALRAGIPVPRSVLVSGRGDLQQAMELIGYPAVIKPVRSRILTGDMWLPATVHFADSETELRRHYDTSACLALGAALIQERIVGAGVGLFALFDRGELVVEFAHRRIRENPPAGGVSVLAESVPVDRRLREYALQLLAPIGWHGVAMVEFKQDARTGEFVLMEVNGRFWGSLQLAIDAGVDFPRFACELALRHRPRLASPYRIGVRSRWLLGDLDHLTMRLVKSHRALHLPDETASKWRALADFVRSGGSGVRCDVFRMGDLCPAVHEVREQLASLAKSVARRSRRLVTRTHPQPSPPIDNNCESSGIVC